jgi:hypothetical protein
VQSRVDTHLKLRRAQLAERELLEKTLGGAVGTLWELIQLTSPILAQRSRSIRDIVCFIRTVEQPAGAWQYDLAATLCLVGCLTLPDHVFEKGYSGKDLSRDEEQMFQSHPEAAARLLANIPRLETVSEIIHNQLKPSANPLHLAIELDRRIFRGMPFGVALNELRTLSRFHSRMLQALANYEPANVDLEVRRLPIRALRPGMVIETDVLTPEGGLLILKKGTTLTETWLERLNNFVRTRGVMEYVNVRIPRIENESVAS